MYRTVDIYFHDALASIRDSMYVLKIRFSVYFPHLLMLQKIKVNSIIKLFLGRFAIRAMNTYSV